MTLDEAKNLKSYDHHCTCGGYAASMNGRDPRHPHMDWCPQRQQFEQRAALIEAVGIKEK